MNQEKVTLILNQVSAGKTLTEACKEVGVSRPYANTMLNARYKEQYDKAKVIAEREMDKLRDKAALLIRKGITAREASRQTGLSLSHTFKVFKIEQDKKIAEGNTLNEVVKRRVLRGDNKFVIANDLNVSTRTIERRLKKLNMHTQTQFEKEIAGWGRRKMSSKNKKAVAEFLERCNRDCIQLDTGNLRTDQQMSNIGKREELSVLSFVDRQNDFREFSKTQIDVPFNERLEEDQIKLFNSDLWMFEHNLTEASLNDIIEEVTTIQGMSNKAKYLEQFNISLTDLLKKGFN